MVVALIILAFMVYITMNGNEFFSNKSKLSDTENSVNNQERRAQYVEKFAGSENTLGSEIVDSGKKLVSKAKNMMSRYYDNKEPAREVAKFTGTKTDKERTVGELSAEELRKEYLKKAGRNFMKKLTPSDQGNMVVPKTDVMDEQFENNMGQTTDPAFKPVAVSGLQTAPAIISYDIYNVNGIDDNVVDAAPFRSNGNAVPNNYTTVTNMVGSKASGANEDPNDIYKISGTDTLVAPVADRFFNTNSISGTNRNATHDFRGDIPLTYNENYTPFYQSTIYGEPLTINRLGDCKK